MELIMVHSYKGGSGKSLISLNLAKILTQQNKKVLVIEADFTMPSFMYIFKDLDPDIYFNNYLNRQEGLEKYIYNDKNTGLNIVFCSPNISSEDKIFSFDDNWYIDRRNRLVSEFKALEDKYDYIIFDMGPGKNYFTIITLGLSDYVLLVVRLDESSKYGSYNLLDSFYSNTLTENKRFLVLFNQVPNHELISDTLNNWITYYNVFGKLDLSFDHIYYDSETAYHIIESGVVLPESNPVYKRIQKCWTLFYNS